MSPEGCSTPRRIGRLTVGHNVSINSTQLNSTQLRQSSGVERVSITSTTGVDEKGASVCCYNYSTRGPKLQGFGNSQ
jgi:hypothetical protein